MFELIWYALLDKIADTSDTLANIHYYIDKFSNKLENLDNFLANWVYEQTVGDTPPFFA